MPSPDALSDPRAFLRSLFDAAVAAADPRSCLPGHLPKAPTGRTVVLGAGKAAAAMARAAEDHWQGTLSGLVITRYGHGVPCRSIDVVEAAHPVPDGAGVAATQRALAMLRGLTADDLVIFLASGGGSSLFVQPAPGLSLAEKQAVTRTLLKGGADIHAINCVRKHLSGVKGGRLALAAHPAAVCGLIVSDVVGDDPATVASGPTVPDPTTRQDAARILARYGIATPNIDRWLAREEAETPKPGDARFRTVSNVVIATARDALGAAARAAEQAGIRVIALGASVTGEARDVGAAHAARAREMQRGSGGPCLLLSGGETTVTVSGNGRGGRNGEYLLSFALALKGSGGIWAIACDTDGIDGTEDSAGALLDPYTLQRAWARNLDAAAALARNDSYSVFEAAGDLVRTGPTRTNVNDFRAILIVPRYP